MKTLLILTSLMAAAIPSQAANVLLLSDNFDTANNTNLNINTSGELAARQAGTLESTASAAPAGSTWTEFTGTGNAILSNQLNVPSAGAVRNNADFEASLTSVDLSAVQGFILDFKMDYTGTAGSATIWTSPYLSTHTGDERANSRFGFLAFGSGDIQFYGGDGVTKTVTTVTNATLASLVSGWNITNLNSYSLVATRATATTGTYDAFINGIKVASNIAYAFGTGGDNGEVNFEIIGPSGGAGLYDDFSITTVTDPVISGLSPLDGAVSVPANANLVATFNESIVVGTGDITIRNLDTLSDTVITLPNAQVSVSGAVLTINPTANLDAPGTNYAIQIAATAIDDTTGNSFAGISNDTTWNFTTAAPDTTAPTVATLNPADNSTNVTTTTNLVVTFSENIAIGTGDITIKNLDAPSSAAIPVGDAQVSVSGAVLTINPTADLAAGKNYAIQIAATAITDLAGNPFAGIANDTTWSFTTDGTAPTVVTLSPADNATYVATTTNLVVTFSENIAIGTGNIILKNLTDTTDTTIDITSGSPQVAVAGAVLTINPTADLTADKNYAIQITATAIKDASGNFFAGIANDTTWNFTVNITQESSSTLRAYAADVSASDLLHGLTPVTTGWNTTNNASPLELTDGIHGGAFQAVVGDAVQGAWTTVGATATYNLGTGPGGAGYDITSVRSIADWVDSGFGNQAWTIEVKPVGGSYSTLATVNYQPFVATGGGTTKVTLTHPSGVLATGIESIKVTANQVNGGTNAGAFVWRELDVFGVPSSGGSAYDTWKAANATGSNPDDDTDGDGVTNAVEFVLGGTSATDDLGKLPTVNASGTNMTFTFVRKQSSIDPKTSVAIEVGTDLATWDTSPSPYTVPDGAIVGPPITVVKGVPAGFDTVTLTVAQDSARKFARLKVVITP